MSNSGSTFTPLDPEIERITRAISKAVREATIAQTVLVENQQLISYDSKKEIAMADVPP